MTPTFNEFWDKLIDNPHWLDWMERIARTEQKNLRKAAETVYGNMLADPDSFQRGTVEEQRKYVGNILKNQKPEPVKPQLQQMEVKKEPEPVIEISEEEIKRRLKEWADVINKVETNFNVPKISTKEAIEEGGWLPKKQAEYHRTPDEVLIFQDLIKKAAAEFYKGSRYISGFTHFPFGEFTVFASSKEDADKIMEEATKSINQVKE